MKRLSSIRGRCKVVVSCETGVALEPASDIGGARVGSPGCVPIRAEPGLLFDVVFDSENVSSVVTLGYSTCCADGETTGNDGAASARELEISGGD